MATIYTSRKQYEIDNYAKNKTADQKSLLDASSEFLTNAMNSVLSYFGKTPVAVSTSTNGAVTSATYANDQSTNTNVTKIIIIVMVVVVVFGVIIFMMTKKQNK